ncbi:MAG: UDP-N-acetylglucosamine--LPS N-acetylglucosamine transferase [Pseudomonadota bacterium]
MASKPRDHRILAVASAGGHFQQLMALRAGYAEAPGARVTYMTTLPGLAGQFGAAPQITVPDCNADTKVAALRAGCIIGWHVLWLRPHVIVTTGALPGLLALLWGRLTGARTLWIDSVANAEDLSASGRMARRVAHLTLSQWPDVAASTGTRYEGSVL